MRLALASLLVIVPAWSPTAQARDLFDRATLSGVVVAGPVIASNHDVWTDGGTGKIEHRGADLAADAVVAWRPDITDRVAAHLSLAVQPSVRGAIGLDEAYLRLRRDSDAAIDISARVGLFFPPASLEHDGAEWTTHHTLTPSAIGSWIAEEVKVLGGEVTWHTAIGERPARVTLSAFGANDTAGSLLTFRGWALHGIRATAGQTLPLPPVTPVFPEQAARTRPVVEVDGRIGVYGKVDLAVSGALSLTAMVYANRGDPTALRNGQYAWNTRFVTAGASLRTAGDTTVLVQAMAGRSAMGLDPARQAVTDVSFRSAYLLVARPVGAGSLTGRLDAFAVDDQSFLDLEDNRERGLALTGAWATPLSGATELVTEVMGVSSDRAARTRLGLRWDRTEVQTRIALRTRF